MKDNSSAKCTIIGILIALVAIGGVILWWNFKFMPDLREASGVSSEVDNSSEKQVMYVTNETDYREEPFAQAESLGKLVQGERITTTGKVEESDWYEFEQSDGTMAYVSGAYLSETKTTAE